MIGVMKPVMDQDLKLNAQETIRIYIYIKKKNVNFFVIIQCTSKFLMFGMKFTFKFSLSTKKVSSNK